MLFRIFSFFIIVGCSACRPSVLESALERAGENRIELERVLRHYSEEDKDSLKWEAARFLIENMPGHLSIGGDSIGPYYAACRVVQNVPDSAFAQFFRLPVLVRKIFRIEYLRSFQFHCASTSCIIGSLKVISSPLMFTI